ncbi:MAG: ABC transporter substrate-binding protein [Bacillales bacterium]|nr:ABC transporter substrate-binding protein [Bacillales bacterium]
MKKIITVLSLVFTLALSFSLAGCTKTTTVGILQLVTHDALDACTTGFEEALADGGFVDGDNIVIEFRNPEADSVALNSYASELVRSCDIVLGIATDAAVALKNARENEGSDIPILFTAVTDPVAAGLVTALDVTDNNVTGTSDASDVAKQIQMVKKILPNATEIGVLYHSSEVNSQVQATAAQTEATSQNLGFETWTVNEVSELNATLTAISNSDIDALFLPTDNLVASNIQTIADAMIDAGILTVCGEESMTTKGGCVTYSIDYAALGVQTGEMAVEILNGKSVAEIPVGNGLSDLLVVLNETSLTAIGLNPDTVRSALQGN